MKLICNIGGKTIVEKLGKEIAVSTLMDSDVEVGNDFSQCKCPVCNFEYNHIMGIRLETGDDYKLWSGRGNLAIIDMCCENNHNWEFCVGFHKGISHVFYRIGKDDSEFQFGEN